MPGVWGLSSASEGKEGKRGLSPSQREGGLSLELWEGGLSPELWKGGLSPSRSGTSQGTRE
eukprot:13227265-Heterocapsa_arctica.AAC.1